MHDVVAKPHVGARITGRVMLDGTPVRYFGVSVLQADEWTVEREPTAFRQPDGRFDIAFDGRPLHVVMAGPGFAREVVAVDHAADVGVIEVHRGRTLEGHVRDAAGMPIADAEVYLDQGPRVGDSVVLGHAQNVTIVAGQITMVSCLP